MSSLEASKGLMSLIGEGKAASDPWVVNHRIRLITTTSLATIGLYGATENKVDGAVLDAVLSAIFYLAVLLMAAAPALVTEKLLSDLQLKLANLAHADVESNVLTSHATQLMQRIACMQGRGGMQFVGVSVTIGGAIRVGTALCTIAIFVVKLRLS